MMIRTQNNDKGFVLVYAVFLSGIILTIGVGALGLVLRGFQLTTTSRDSQRALFAADSAIECVTYWDLKFADEGLDESPFAFGSSPSPIPANRIFCNGADADIKAPAPVGRMQNPDTQPCESSGIALGSVSFPFEVRDVEGESRIVAFDLHFDNGAYAAVTVERSAVLAAKNLSTRISACGFNSDDPAFSRRVERGITFTY